METFQLVVDQNPDRLGFLLGDFLSQYPGIIDSHLVQFNDISECISPCNKIADFNLECPSRG